MLLLLLFMLPFLFELLAVDDDRGVLFGVRQIGVLLEVGPTSVEVTLLGEEDRYEGGEASDEAAITVATTVDGVRDEHKEGCLSEALEHDLVEVEDAEDDLELHDVWPEDLFVLHSASEDARRALTASPLGDISLFFARPAAPSSLASSESSLSKSPTAVSPSVCCLGEDISDERNGDGDFRSSAEDFLLGNSDVNSSTR